MILLCKRCGLVWDSPVVQGRGPSFIKIIDIVTPCPRCGHSVPLTGLYSFDSNGDLSSISGAEVTRVQYELLRELLERAKAEHYTIDQVTAKIAEINPRLDLKKILPKNFTDVIGLLTLLLAILAYCKPNDTPSQNNYYDLSRQIIYGQQPMMPIAAQKNAKQKDTNKKQKPSSNNKKSKRK